MKKILLIISCLVFFNLAYADDPCQSAYGPYGPMTCAAGVTTAVSANGPVTMQNTTVKNSTKINGALDATKVTFNSLTVNGKVNLKDTTISGTTTINGYLVATNTIFSDTLTLATNALQLKNCTSSDIVINNNNGDGVVSPQTITLSGTTKVNGTITFKQQGGIVYLGANATIKGKVVGGKIVVEKANTTSKKNNTAQVSAANNSVESSNKVATKDNKIGGKIIAEKTNTTSENNNTTQASAKNNLSESNNKATANKLVTVTPSSTTINNKQAVENTAISH